MFVGRSRMIVVAMITLVITTIDQFTKILAQSRLRGEAARIYWNDFFRLQYAENTGGMLGFGSELTDSLRFWGLTVLPLLLLLALLAYLLLNRRLNRVQTVGLSLIFGGGLSNIIDRLFNSGVVIDFMNMGIGGLRTGIFNIADVSIMSGLGLMILFGGLRDKPAEAAASGETVIRPEPGEAE